MYYVLKVIEVLEATRDLSSKWSYRVTFSLDDLMNEDEPDLEGAEFAFDGSQTALIAQIDSWCTKQGWVADGSAYLEMQGRFEHREFAFKVPPGWLKRRIRKFLRELLNDIEYTIGDIPVTY